MLVIAPIIMSDRKTRAAGTPAASEKLRTVQAFSIQLLLFLVAMTAEPSIFLFFDPR
jgi:hypothetical protein